MADTQTPADSQQGMRLAPSLEWVESSARFAELAAPWDELAGDALPYLRHRWFESWWRAFGKDRPLRTCVLWDGDRMTACLPAFQGRGALHAMANDHTPLFEPPAAGPGELGELVKGVLGEHPVLALVGVPAGGTALNALEAGSARVVSGSWQVSPIVDTTGTFEDYRRNTRPKWLKRLARYRRQMERNHGLELVVAEAPSELEPLLTESFAVEASGWKGKEGTAIASAPETEAFYRDVCDWLWRSGELRLSQLRLDGRLAAVDLAFDHGDRLYSLKTGYDETRRNLVPGLVLRLSLIEYCFERGLRAHELLGADMPWKRNFSTSEREHLYVRCYRGRMRGAFGRLPPALARVRGGVLRRLRSTSRWIGSRRPAT